MCRRTTYIASAVPVERVRTAKLFRWCHRMKPAYCATSSAYCGAPSRLCRRRSSKSSNRRRCQNVRKTQSEVARPNRVSTGTAAAIIPAQHGAMAMAAAVQIAAVHRAVAERVPALEPAAQARAHAASVNLNEAGSARTVSAPWCADSQQNLHPSSDASAHIPRWPADIRACCRNRSAYLRIRKNKPLRVASAARCHR